MSPPASSGCTQPRTGDKQARTSASPSLFWHRNPPNNKILCIKPSSLKGSGEMGEVGFGSGEWIGEGVGEAKPASLGDMMTTKPAPHEAAANGLMPADKDEAMSTKPAPHEAATSGQMLVNSSSIAASATASAGAHKNIWFPLQ